MISPSRPTSAVPIRDAIRPTPKLKNNGFSYSSNPINLVAGHNDEACDGDADKEDSCSSSNELELNYPPLRLTQKPANCTITQKIVVIKPLRKKDSRPIPAANSISRIHPFTSKLPQNQPTFQQIHMTSK